MATFTDPMNFSFFLDRGGPVDTDRGRSGGDGGTGTPSVCLVCLVCSGAARRAAFCLTACRIRLRRLTALAVDQLRQPADLPVHRLQAVALELEGVAVDPLAGAGERGP
jgi:hypothetical protein